MSAGASATLNLMNKALAAAICPLHAPLYHHEAACLLLEGNVTSVAAVVNLYLTCTLLTATPSEARSIARQGSAGIERGVVIGPEPSGTGTVLCLNSEPVDAGAVLS